MFSRRWKKTANLISHPVRPRHIGIPESSESSGSSIMPSWNDRHVAFEAPTLVLGMEDGSWAESDYYFVRCLSDPKSLEFCYRALSTSYGGPDGTEGCEPYSQVRMDQMFAEAPETRYHCAPLHQDMAKYTGTQIDNILKTVFHFGAGM